MSGDPANSCGASRFNFDTQVAEHLSIYRRMISEHASHPEGTRQVAIPEDYVELMEKTLRIGEAEFSLAELAARAFRIRPTDEEFSEAPASESALERIYALKNHIPPRIKQPAKLALAKVFEKAIARRNRDR